MCPGRCAERRAGIGLHPRDGDAIEGKPRAPWRRTIVCSTGATRCPGSASPDTQPGGFRLEC